MDEIQRKMMSSNYIPTGEEVETAYRAEVREAIRESVLEVIAESMRAINAGTAN